MLLWTRLRFAGLCNICGYRGLFSIRPEFRTNLRETLDCPSCESNSRDRMLAAVMADALRMPRVLAHWPATKAIRILEPSGYRGRARVLAEKTDYVPLTHPEDNLEKLTYGDGSFDHVVAADVFEHVRFDDLAFREVYRVLKPDGYFFLQVPYYHDLHTVVLVEPNGAQDRCIVPPQYHAKHTLVYRIYGHDLLARLAAIGFWAYLVDQEVRRLGICRQNLIVCKKEVWPNSRQ